MKISRCVVTTALVTIVLGSIGQVFAQMPPAPPRPTFGPPPITSKLTIDQKYAALGGAGGRMGAAIGPETPLSDRSGRYRRYTNGVILWHPDTGAHELHGAIWSKFAAMSPDAATTPRFLAVPIAMLGYPTTDETATSDRRGAYNAFQRGVIYYIPDLASDFEAGGGAHEMHGEIYEKWKSLYHTGLDLGYPVTDERITPDRRGRFNHFERGSIYWTATTGAHEVHGDIRERWKQMGWERSTLGYPTSDEHDAAGGGRISDFERGSIRQRTVPASLSFVQYNVAFLPKVIAEFYGTHTLEDAYKGKNREQARRALIDNVLRDSPDIVGLTEVFISSDYIETFHRLPGNQFLPLTAPNDRQAIKDGLAGRYPFVAEIPVAETGSFVQTVPVPVLPDAHIVLPRATELLLLSKWPITERNHLIYRNRSGQDSKAGKGILHVRVQPPGHPTQYDVFLTHTQNPGEGNTEAERARSREALSLQLDAIAVFIAAHSSPERPALLMGDLNVNGNDSAKRLDLMRRLGRPASLDEPVDLWPVRGGLGLTSDDASSFEAARRGTPPSDPWRFRRGSRIDWFLSWPGTRFWPSYENTQVLVWQFGEGNDISDHYGLKTRQVNLRELTVIQRVPVHVP